jgi:glycosyltransferase involved in cell wall biosynthesis
MKLLIVIRSIAFGGGAESLVFDIYAKMKEILGYENVRLVVFQSSHIFNYSKYNKFEDELSNDPNFIICNSYIRLKILGKNIINNDEFQNIVNDFKPDIIHSHLYLAELFSRSIEYKNAKWVSHFHDNMIQFENFSIKTLFNRSKFSNFIEKKYLFNRYRANGGNYFIAISKDTYSYVNKTCCNSPVSLLYNCIDTNKFKRTKTIPLDKIRIVNIGSFVEKKNQRLFIEIAKILKLKKYDFEIVLLGYGPLQKEIIELIKDNNLEQNFTLPGMVDNVNEYLNNSNFYVHTAIYEPFGLVLIEAMCCYLPVIALNGLGNTELIKDGKNGYLIDDQNAITFVNKICYLWNNNDQYRSISEYAQNFSKKYNIDNYSAELLTIYKNILK